MPELKQRESSIHRQIVNYLKFRYPNVIFRTDFASGMRMTMGQALKHKALQSSRAFPDITIYEPVGGSHGLMLEVKRENPYRKDGRLKSDPHLQEQADMLDRLNRLGYRATFVVGFDHARAVIDGYFSMRK